MSLGGEAPWYRTTPPLPDRATQASAYDRGHVPGPAADPHPRGAHRADPGVAAARRRVARALAVRRLGGIHGGHPRRGPRAGCDAIPAADPRPRLRRAIRRGSRAADPRAARTRRAAAADHRRDTASAR